MSASAGAERALTLDASIAGDLHSPVMLLALKGWFDVAGVATTALQRIVDGGPSVIVGEIDADPFFDFTVERPMATFDEHGERVTEWPITTICVSRHPSHDLVVVTGVEPHLLWRTYSEAIAHAADVLGCDVAVTLGAAAEAVPHTRTPRVVGSTTSDSLAARLGLSKPTYQGVTGVIGALLVELDAIGLTAVSLRVGVPHYLGNSNHPQASAALVRHLSHVLGDPLPADFTEEIVESDEDHAEFVAADPDMGQYVAMLEHEFDRRAEAQIPSPDELGRQFEQFLRRRERDDEP